jgi:hypothetical protein
VSVLIMPDNLSSKSPIRGSKGGRTCSHDNVCYLFLARTTGTKPICGILWDWLQPNRLDDIPPFGKPQVLEDLRGRNHIES